ncbi:thiamine diphosphate-binding fold containing protein [Parasponia andersonii]|uniref:Thiamine diphosphate-binding fold containing protein n=1 Tax=Parasponia andersonii TaxID=3476 RepID=A0A2P5AW31_PARAD|nr:thiamine diphosphate-binding fold containing protein [Parasponia andersonii]
MRITAYVAKPNANLSLWRFTFNRAQSQLHYRYVNEDDNDDQQGLDFPVGRVTYTSEIRFTSESAGKRVSCYRVLDDDGDPIMKSSVEVQLKGRGRIFFYVTTMGEEATNIASAAALSSDDIVLPRYREPGVLLCTQLPQAIGVDYSLKMDKRDACVVTFFGDGGRSEGDCHASLNYAAVMEAPMIFICRNNGWAIGTLVQEQFRNDGIVVKGQAYGIRSILVDGNDALAVYSAIRRAREMAITEQRSILVEVLTYRVGHHSTSDDSAKYGASNEIEYWKMERSPLNRFRKWVERKGWWNDTADSELRNSVKRQLLQAIQAAEKTEKPPLAELFTDVYDEPPENLKEQEKLLRETIGKHQQDYPSEVPI